MASEARTVGEASVERTTPEPPADEIATQGVLIGAGGDPLILGLPIFVVGSISLGFGLAGYLGAALGAIVPIVAAATALGQFVSMQWAIGLGQSIVACIFGLFLGFWGSLAVLLLGLGHNWFGIPPTELVHAEIVYYISWDIVVFLLLFPVLRLPAVYIAIIVFVILALTLVILGLEYPGSVATFNHLAAICVFAFAGLGLWAFLNVSSIAMGGPPSPPLGPPAIK